MKKNGLLRLIITTVVLALCYALLEGGVRLVDRTYPFGILGVKPGYESIRRRAATEGKQWEDWARQTFPASALLGKGRITKRTRKTLIWRPGVRTKYLLFGDSVTVADYVGEGNSYAAAVDNALSLEQGQIINLAVDGYGLDQMIVKALNAAEWYRPDVIVIAYIPHDLLRVGATFLYEYPKLKFKASGNKLILELPERIPDFYQRYHDAKHRGTLSIWTLGMLWDNREYILPSFYEKHYHRVFAALRELTETSARDLNADVLFLRLTNFTEFRGREELTAVAQAVFGETGNNSQIIGHFDTDECTRTEAEQRNLKWKDTFVYHPGRTGHEILATCITRLLRELTP